MALNIVLFEPEIPANTGNIGRTCVATNTRLHLIEPLGFSLSEKALKRAGMDYWKELDVTTYVNWEDFQQRNPQAKIYYATTKGRHVYSDVTYEEDCFIMFGRESGGIPEEIGFSCGDRRAQKGYFPVERGAGGSQGLPEYFPDFVG